MLEYQNYADKSMPWRIFQYAALLKLAYHQKQQRDILVVPIVIWANKRVPPEPLYESLLDQDIGITCRYRHIRL